MTIEVLIKDEWVVIVAESVAFRGNKMTINTKNSTLVIENYQDKVRDPSVKR